MDFWMVPQFIGSIYDIRKKKTEKLRKLGAK